MGSWNRRQVLRAGILAPVAGLYTKVAHSQSDYPQRPIRIIVPSGAGGVGDAAIRVLAPGIEQRLGQKLVIESKPGATGNIGTLEVARSEADGYTVLVAATHNFVINQFLMKMSFDPMAVLTPIAKVAEIPIVFCINPAVPARGLAEFIGYARAHPGILNYGSPGNGSVNHLLSEELKRVAAVQMTHVPYRGSPPATLAVIANEVQLFPVGLAAVAGHLGEGRLIALAVTANQRLAMLPNTPTVVEAGFPSLAVSNWWGMAVPKQTSQSIIARLTRTVTDTLGDAGVRERFAALGMVVPTQTREQFITSLSFEADLWSAIIRRGNIAIE
jgi:tripartite-type tricarboxylate transporter receptor subunit TctC